MSLPLVSDIIYLRIIGPILACMEPAFNPFFSLLMLLKILIILISISAALYREKKSFSLWHFVWRLKRDSVSHDHWSIIGWCSHEWILVNLIRLVSSFHKAINFFFTVEVDFLIPRLVYQIFKSMSCFFSHNLDCPIIGNTKILFF